MTSGSFRLDVLIFCTICGLWVAYVAVESVRHQRRVGIELRGPMDPRRVDDLAQRVVEPKDVSTPNPNEES